MTCRCCAVEEGGCGVAVVAENFSRGEPDPDQDIRC